VARNDTVWHDLIGAQHDELLALLNDAVEEDDNATRTRVWTALEALKKAGVPARSPLVYEGTESGWVTLTSGRFTALSYVAEVDGNADPMAIMILTEAH
jgi:enediyne polyketide synthase